MYSYDKRVVITLDAGGTNLVFGAMQANKFICEPITLPSNAHDLDLCLATMVDGFTRIINSLDVKPVAISFAFPGRLSERHYRRLPAQLPLIPRRCGSRPHAV